MAYGHSSGLPPWEAPVMIAGMCKLFFSFHLNLMQTAHVSNDGDTSISNTKRNGSNTTKVIIKDIKIAKFIITRTTRTAVMTIVVLELSICYMVTEGYGHMLAHNATFGR